VTIGGEVFEGAFLGKSRSDVTFKGIPYAAPPVGEFRWKPPQPVEPREGILQATEYSAACPQTDGNVVFTRDIARALDQDPALVPDLGETSEDCLYLNVWTANWGSEDKRPVMLWIYGGANIWGTAEEIPYDGANLARKGVVVVTFNYRVGVFGFLAHAVLTAESPHRSSGNYGLLDQIEALKWVQRNIAAFGGDPQRVTIFGESAGGEDVAYLVASPLAKGLFHRAISQSGGYPVRDMRTLASEEARGERLPRELGVERSDGVLTALRDKSAAEVLAAAADFGFGANVDGWVLTDKPDRMFANGKQNDVPLIIGANSDEWTTMIPYYPEVDLEGFREQIGTRYGDLSERALSLYPVSEPDDVEKAVLEWQTDDVFLCPSKRMAGWMDKVESPAYFYYFTRVLPSSGGQQLGAYHAAEIAYVFDNLVDEAWVPREAVDARLADIMSSYWVRFAATGDPNREGLPPWPTYDRESDRYLELGEEITAGAGLRREFCHLFELDLAQKSAKR
jgi:para-nitrobenzyl esterase